MVEMPTHAPAAPRGSAKVPLGLAAALDPRMQPEAPLVIDTFVSPSPVNQNGSFEFDRMIKTGYVQRRTQKTKTWRSIYLVLRPNVLSIYKTDKEDKLRHKIDLSELTAVTFLRDPKHKREHLFALFSPSKNYYFQAPSAKDAQEWVDTIRSEARIEEEEEEMFLASPVVRRHAFPANLGTGHAANNHPEAVAAHVRMASSSPEPQMPPPARRLSTQPAPSPSQAQPLARQHPYNQPEALAWSGNEMGLSDCSDGDGQGKQLGGAAGLSSDSLAPGPSSAAAATQAQTSAAPLPLPSTDVRLSQAYAGLELDPERVIWQGWLWLLRSKGGVRQWKDSWAVLRPRNLILYKDETEYAAQLVVPLPSIVNVVERDPLSRTKKHCLQVITEEKSYRFSAHDEETLIQCLGAFKSLLAKRRGLDLRTVTAAAAAAAAAGNSPAPLGGAGTAASAAAAAASSSTPHVPTAVPISS